MQGILSPIMMIILINDIRAPTTFNVLRASRTFSCGYVSYREHFLLLMKISFLPPTLPWSRPTPPALDPLERRETDEIKGIIDNPSLFRKRDLTISFFPQYFNNSFSRLK